MCTYVLREEEGKWKVLIPFSHLFDFIPSFIYVRLSILLGQLIPGRLKAEIEGIHNDLKEKVGLYLPNHPRAPFSTSSSRPQTQNIIRLNLDPFHWIYRPFFFYLATEIFIGRMFSPFLLRTTGFRKVLAPGKACLKSGISYWYKASPKPSKKKPDARRSRSTEIADCIVLLHGVGIGPSPFLHFLQILSKSTPDLQLPVLAIEVPFISLRWAKPGGNPAGHVAEDIAMLLKERGHKRACVIGHSYGTAMASWLLQSLSARPLIHSLVLIDPISLLLFRSEVVQVLYRQCVSALDHLMDFLVFTDPHVSAAFRREFVWHKALLWVRVYSIPWAVRHVQKSLHLDVQIRLFRSTFAYVP